MVCGDVHLTKQKGARLVNKENSGLYGIYRAGSEVLYTPKLPPVGGAPRLPEPLTDTRGKAKAKNGHPFVGYICHGGFQRKNASSIHKKRKPERLELSPCKTRAFATEAQHEAEDWRLRCLAERTALELARTQLQEQRHANEQRLQVCLPTSISKWITLPHPSPHPSAVDDTIFHPIHVGPT